MVVCGMQDHYAVSAYVKRQIRSALQRMVDAGRLEAVPNHTSLFRLGGVIRQLSQEAGIEWPRIKPGTGLLDPRVLALPSFPATTLTWAVAMNKCSHASIRRCLSNPPALPS